jgi:hypothetical protein
LESPSLFSSLSIILSELLDFFLRCLFFFGDPLSVPVGVVPVVVLGREEDGLRVDMMELSIVVLPMTLLTVGATRVLVFTGINQLLVIVIVLVQLQS